MGKVGIPKGYRMLLPISLLADLTRETDKSVLVHCKRLKIRTIKNKLGEKRITANSYLKVKRDILKKQYYQDRKERGLKCQVEKK